MSRELMDLFAKINKKKQEVKDFIAQDKVEEAKEAKKELETMQEKFNILFEIEGDEEEAAKNKIKAKAKNSGEKKEKNIVAACINLVKARLKNEPAAKEDLEAYDALNETTEEEGAILVPQDIRTEIKELRRSEDALETLVNVENVTTLSGSRVIEKNADSVPFDNVEEAAEFPETDEPKFEKVEYKVKKKGGILKVTRELLEDAAENVMAYLKKWIAKKQKATRNALIIKAINTITEGKEVLLETVDTLKDIFNVKLDPAVAVSSIILTNQTGYNWLDKLKDSDGNYILQPNPTEPTRKMLFGLYPVKVVSNKTLQNDILEESATVPFVCGSLKEAITIFQREGLTLDINGVAGGYWEKDMYGIKVRERLDCVAMDKEAIVKGYVEVKIPTETEPKTKEELNSMTVTQLKNLAKKNSVDLTGKTSKNDIVEAIATALEISE